MSKPTKRRSARALIRKLGGIRRCQRSLLDGDVPPDTKVWLTKLIARYDASEKRRKKREAHKRLMRGTRFRGPDSTPADLLERVTVTARSTGTKVVLDLIEKKLKKKNLSADQREFYEEHKQKIEDEKQANEKRKAEMEGRKLGAGMQEALDRAQPRTKRRSPRTGLAKFGITL